MLFGVAVGASKPSPLSASAIASTATSTLAKIDVALVDVNVNFQYENENGAGTGMVLGSGGEILTNNHVVRDATSISVVSLANHKSFPATVVGYDVNADVAVLHLIGATHLHRIPLGNSAGIRVGDAVTAIGNAGGIGGRPSTSTGKITALHRSITAQDQIGGSEQLTGLLGTNATLQPGDSGGPLVSSGKVVGMDTAGSSSFTLSSNATAGFAVPINEALRIARNIESGRASSAIHIGPTAFLGVNVQPKDYFNGTARGLVVTNVIAGTPAQLAGLIPGEIITSFNGATLNSPATLTNLIAATPPGTSIELGLIDASGNSVSASITLTSGPAQ